MLSLKEFKKSSIETKNLNILLGGAKGDDTKGGFSAFGKSTISSCEKDNRNGTYDHYYGDESLVRFTEAGH